MNNFYQLADQLHSELETLFDQWPTLHPDYRPRFRNAAHALEVFRRNVDKVKEAFGIRLLPTLQRTADTFARYAEVCERFNYEWERVHLVLNAKRNYRRSAWLPTGALLLVTLVTK